MATYNENDFFTYNTLQDKVITFHDISLNETFGLNVCNFQKSMTEGKYLVITLLNGTATLEFGDENAAKLAHNSLVLTVDQLALNCSTESLVANNLPQWLLDELNYLALSGPIPLFNPITEVFEIVYPPLYRSYVANITQIAPNTQNSGPLVVGRRYVISAYAPGDDFTNVGALLNQNGEIFIATGDTPTNWSNLSDVDSFGEPVANVLYNSIGDIVWTYSTTGSYLATCVSGFTLGQTVVIPPQNNYADYFAFGTFNEYGYSIIDGDSIALFSLRRPFAGSPAAADGLITSDLIEIRVYQ